MHPESNDVGKRSLSEPEPGEVSESPESMVPANDPKAKIDSPTRNYPHSLSLVEKAVNDIATASSSDMTTHISPDLHKHPHPSIVDEARRLLMPIIVKTVQLQEPQAAIRKIEGKVSQLITDQHCWDFVRLAKEVKEQMRSRGDRSWSPMRNSAYENRGRESLNGSDRSGFDQVAETHGELRVWNGDASRDRGSGSSGTGYRRRELPSPVRDIPDADYPRQNEPRRDRSRERCRERSQDTIRRSSSRNSPRHDDGRKVHTNGQGSKRGRGSRSPSGEVSRPAKVLRGLSPAVSSQPPAQISQPPVVRKEKEPGGDSSAIEPGSFNLSTSSSPKKATPKMPKAMLADHTVLAIDSFLANASMVSTATTQPISASEKVPGESDGVLQSAPSGAREEKTQLILAANDDLSHSGIVNQNNQVVQADAGSSVADIQVSSKAGEVERHVQETETMDTSETIYPNQIQPEKSGQDRGCLLLRVLKQVRIYGDICGDIVHLILCISNRRMKR